MQPGGNGGTNEPVIAALIRAGGIGHGEGTGGAKLVRRHRCDVEPNRGGAEFGRRRACAVEIASGENQAELARRRQSLRQAAAEHAGAADDQDAAHWPLPRLS